MGFGFGRRCVIIEGVFFCEGVVDCLPAGGLVFCPIVDRIRMETSMRACAAVAGRWFQCPVNSGLLEMQDVDTNEWLIESSKNMLNNEETNIESTPLDEKLKKARNKEILFKTLSTIKTRMVIALQEEMERCLEVIKDIVMFVTVGGGKYGVCF